MWSNQGASSWHVREILVESTTGGSITCASTPVVYQSTLTARVSVFQPPPSTRGGSASQIDQFMATPFGQQISTRCATRFLRELPAETKLIIMFGLGTRLSYVETARRAIEMARPGHWRTINEVAYTDDKITVVHVEHFASQGANIPNWLGQNQNPRVRLGLLARNAVEKALFPSSERETSP